MTSPLKGSFLLPEKGGFMNKESSVNAEPAEIRSWTFNIPKPIAQLEIVAAKEMCERVLGYTPEDDAHLPEKILAIVEKINNGQEIPPKDLPRKKEGFEEVNFS